MFIHKILSYRESGCRLSCLECKDTFTKHSNLKRHRKKHESTHPFTCRKCTQRFKTKSLLQKHSKNCKQDKREVPVKSENEDNEEDDVPLSALIKVETDNER